MSKWISTQDDELVLTVEMTAVESKFDDHSNINPAFNRNRLPVSSDSHSEVRASASVESHRVTTATSGQNRTDTSTQRNPMKEALTFGSVRFNALSSPHSFRQSEMRSPGSGRMTLSNSDK